MRLRNQPLPIQDNPGSRVATDLKARVGDYVWVVSPGLWSDPRDVAHIYRVVQGPRGSIRKTMVKKNGEPRIAELRADGDWYWVEQ